MHIFLGAVLFLFCFHGLSFAFTKDRPDKSTNDEKIPEFRYDYTYFKDIDGWLKLHQVPADWNEAHTRCKYEGSELATPIDRPMLEMMTSILKNQIYQGVFIGVHASFSYGDYHSTKGISLERMPLTWSRDGPSPDINKRCVVLLRNGTVTNDNCKAFYPYLCYKRNNNETLSACGTIDKKYTYISDLDTCYKIHARRTTWPDAFRTCSAEGGHLLVLNNDKEFSLVFSLLQTYPQDVKENVFVGIIDQDKSGQWTTIHDDILEESGFAKWLPGEPNHAGNAEFCGTVIRGEGYNDAPCDAKLPFVCEKQTDSLRSKDDIIDITPFYRMSL